MIIEEIMVADVVAVEEDTPITQVAELVAQKRIHGVPVIDKERKVVGIITETDFFKKDSSNMLYIPQMIDFVKSGKMEDAGEKNEAMKAIVQGTAKDIMTKDCITVRPETSIEEFIMLVKSNGFNTFPVTNEDGALLGIVTVFDMIKMI
jgi:CBS domain-containing protein